VEFDGDRDANDLPDPVFERPAGVRAGDVDFRAVLADGPREDVEGRPLPGRAAEGRAVGREEDPDGPR
jgi:hypothetical protein